MKNLKWLMALAVGVLVAIACSSKKPEKQRVLVLYYSQTSNTKQVAEEIATRLEADIEELVLKNPYDTDFQATIARSMKEREEGVTPEIEPLKADINQYDVVFIGYPIWFGTYAPPIATLLESIDLTGKKVVPFCTFGSGGLESSVKDLTEKLPNAEILPGYGVRAARIKAVPEEIDQFLKAGGFVEGECVTLENFGEAHEASEEEAAIFDAAVDGYPMIHAKAKTVASRALPNGTEYLFTAEDLPREGAPAMPAMGEMKVYVTVLEGQTPVFTRVVR